MKGTTNLTHGNEILGGGPLCRVLGLSCVCACMCTYRQAVETIKVLECITTYFCRLNILLHLLLLLFLFGLSVLSICFSLNKHKSLSTSFSSSTLKSGVKRKQKCLILFPVTCFIDGKKLSELIIWSYLLGNLHHMSIENLSFSRIYLLFRKYSLNYLGQWSSFLEHLR